MIRLTHEEIAEDRQWILSATGRQDRCYEGVQTLWDSKSDPFEYKCTADETRYYGFNGNLSESIGDLESDLLKDGWTKDHLVPPVGSPCYDRRNLRLCFHLTERGSVDPVMKMDLMQDLEDYNDQTTVYLQETRVDVPQLLPGIFEEHQYVIALDIEADYHEE